MAPTSLMGAQLNWDLVTVNSIVCYSHFHTYQISQWAVEASMFMTMRIKKKATHKNLNTGCKYICQCSLLDKLCDRNTLTNFSCCGIEFNKVFTLTSLNHFFSFTFHQPKFSYSIVKQNVLMVTYLTKNTHWITWFGEPHNIWLNMKMTTTMSSAWIICWLIGWQLRESGFVLPCDCFIGTHWQASVFLLLWNSFVLCWLSVETVVLNHEEDVEHHRE